MSSPQTSSPSILRSGLKAGVSFLFTLASGSLLGIVLSLGVAWYYGGRVGAADGALTASLTRPSFLIGMLLYLFVLAYPVISFFYGWRRALQKIVEAHSLPLAERLSSLAANRLAAVPDSQNKLDSAREWLSEDAVSGKLESVLGASSWGGRAARFAVRRLPWANLLADWETQAKAQGESNVQSLASALSPRIAAALNEIAAPSWAPLIAVAAAHAALFGLGIWLAR
ncbi:MAG: hypothetical protein LBI59_03745 [Candidatus Accumulibacter sp.]|jgi:hypothetical protein|nr:hypothetical protein [Accumulibacter sp.]